MKWDTVSEHEDGIPTTMRAGAAVEFEPWPVLLIIETTLVENIDARFHVGAETTLQRLVLRLGLDDGDVTAGVGLPIKTGSHHLLVDYGYRGDEISDGMLHFFSVGLLF